MPRLVVPSVFPPIQPIPAVPTPILKDIPSGYEPQRGPSLAQAITNVRYAPYGGVHGVSFQYTPSLFAPPQNVILIQLPLNAQQLPSVMSGIRGNGGQRL